ncbi:MAG TPA: potassium transporter TrkG [Yaniella sp.]
MIEPVKRQLSSSGAQLPRSSGRGRTVARKLSDILTGHPGRAAVTMFALVITGFTALLRLPAVSATGESLSLVDAAVTATSAVTVTGLTSLGPDAFSLTGQVIILVAIQVGGLGIVTLGVWLTLLVSRRLSLRTRLLSSESLGVSKLGEVPALLLTVLIFTLSIEALLAAVMLPVFVTEHGLAEGAFHAVFYAVSAFSNAGFVLETSGFDHPVVLTTINIGAFAGALGFPVVYMLYRMVFHRAAMNLHTRLTLEVTVVLLVLGAGLVAAFEWQNPMTLGQLSPLEKVHEAIFASGMTRSGGFSTYEVMDQNDPTLVVTSVLMFIGGGSGSTAGGIKVTTLAVLLLAILAEIRGDEHIQVHHREISSSLVRVAVAVVTAGALLVLTAVVALTAVTDQGITVATFEALSAFGTVGLSTGLTASAPEAGQWILIVLMFVGRVGIITLAAGLAARSTPTFYRYPTERPIIG